MTATDIGGLPAEILGQLARAGLAQDAAMSAAGIPRQTWYRRKDHPHSFRLEELARLAGLMGLEVRVELVPLHNSTVDAVHEAARIERGAR
jgi:uncharacterized protein (DUF2384 family)